MCRRVRSLSNSPQRREAMESTKVGDEEMIRRLPVATFGPSSGARMSSLRQPDQSHSRHHHARLVAVAARLVLGCLPGHDTDPRHERAAVPKTARSRALRNCIPDASQIACCDGSPAARHLEAEPSGDDAATVPISMLGLRIVGRPNRIGSRKQGPDLQGNIQCRAGGQEIRKHPSTCVNRIGMHETALLPGLRECEARARARRSAVVKTLGHGTASRQTMASPLRRCGFHDQRRLQCQLERALKGLVVGVVAPHSFTARVGGHCGLGKHPMPSPGLP